MIRSLRSTWALFKLEEGSPLGAHIAFIATPFIIAFGVMIMLTSFVPIPISVILGVIVFVIVAYLMGWNTSEENDLIERRMALKDSDILFPTDEPQSYLGPKRWISLGRVDPDTFLEAVIPRDPELKNYNYNDLRSMVEYTYMADTFSARNSKPAIRYVTSNTKGAYPVTHLKAPYDYFVEQDSGVDYES